MADSIKVTLHLEKIKGRQNPDSLKHFLMKDFD